MLRQRFNPPRIISKNDNEQEFNNSNNKDNLPGGEVQNNTNISSNNPPHQGGDEGMKMESENSEIGGQVEKQHVDSEKSHNPESKKKQRCKRWPQCKNEGCEFSHPKETCPYFPKCVFGDKCLFIHPNISCKFGYYCTRVGCAYSHPAGYNPGMGMMASMGPMQMGAPHKFKNAKLDNTAKYRNALQGGNRPIIRTTTEVVEPTETQEATNQSVEQ